MILGYLLSVMDVSRVKRIIIYIIGILSVIIRYGYTYCMSINANMLIDHLFDYTSLLSVFLAVSVFLLIKNISWDKLNQSFLDEAQFNVDKMKAKFDPNLNITTKVLVGFPAETIVGVAEDEDVELIAIASSGKGRVTKFFIGSVAEKVIHSFKKDVLLVH